ncbi:leucine-rich repeat-containing protein, putative [Pediculus humanus corporis]|uniref:Leucine-rich repeat-containing protein, putative n=1 Tax=Pediculus humanus subsp. corporis TaxID=121224 RepID=E0VY48_PEDHC|nr:leucine-rich repeat-containing protein, putative [Pediculus humanus corporis]EEB18304.1 leucine-rich repeat-containing protein, putative [Pediculus humanus corporis]
MTSFYNFIRENLVLATIELAALNKKSTLNLNDSEINELPLSLLKIKNLTKLYLKNNKLKSLPHEFVHLKYLKILAMDYNLLYSVPPEIGKLYDLACLNLSYNKLNYLIPEIGKLNKLQVLWLNHTNLKYIPPEIGNCTLLDTFGAREENLLTCIPNEIEGLENLRHLNLSHNPFEKFPDLKDLNNLKFVFLNHNYITDIDLDVLEKMNYVKEINVTGNPINSKMNYYHVKNLKMDAANTDLYSFNDDDDTSESDYDWDELKIYNWMKLVKNI